MTLNKRLDQIVNRALELEALLASGVDGEALVQASREYADLEDIVRRINALRALEQEIEQAQQLLADPEMQEIAKTELEELQERLVNELAIESNKNNILFRDSINAYINAYNKEKGYNVILSRIGDNILYIDSEMNITYDIIEGLNARYEANKK